MVSEASVKKILTLPWLKLSALVVAAALVGGCAGESTCVGDNDSCDDEVAQSTDELQVAPVQAAPLRVQSVAAPFGSIPFGSTPTRAAIPDTSLDGQREQHELDVDAPSVKDSASSKNPGDERSDPEPNPWSPPTHHDT